jgi:ferritin-like metal-binding protein YciE
MKMFSARVEDPHARYVDNLKKALDMERKIANTPPPVSDPVTDLKIAGEFRDYLRQSEGLLERIEGLLRRSATEARV